MMQDEFLLHGATSSTGGCAVLVILNGPIRLEIGANGDLQCAGQQRSRDGRDRPRHPALPDQPDGRAAGRHRPLDPRPSRQVQLLRRRGRGGHDLAAARRAARHPEGGLGRHRDGGERAAPDHERVDDRARGDPGDLRRRDARQPAALLDLCRQLRDRSSPSSCASTCRRPAGARRDIADFIHERARIHRREWADVGKGAVVRDRGDSVYPALESPDQLLVVAAGGPAGGFGASFRPGSATRPMPSPWPSAPASTASRRRNSRGRS